MRTSILSQAPTLLAGSGSAEAEAKALLARRLIEDCVDAYTGELHPTAVVTDNGPAISRAGMARARSPVSLTGFRAGSERPYTTPRA